MLPALLMPTLPSFGLVRGMSNEAYQMAGGLSCTGLKLLARSPRHFFSCMRDELRPPKIDRAGQLEGSLAHCCILEPGEVAMRYAVGPELSRASTAWKSFEALHPRQICVKPSQMAVAMAQNASVRNDPDIAKLFARGEPEVSAFWTDAETGVLCQCRPDFVHPVGDAGVILVDVKTYSDASPDEFARQVARKRYHWQAAWYTDGYSIAAQVPVVGFVFVAVETDWPYACSATMLDEDSLDVARRELRPLVRRYADCNGANRWPGYAAGVTQIELPRWYSERAGD